jgi:hypothetical protein
MICIWPRMWVCCCCSCCRAEEFPPDFVEPKCVCWRMLICSCSC